MCGIAGIYQFNEHDPVDYKELESMATTLKHRGPNNQGIFSAGNGGLAYRRLSIIDPTEQEQPLLTNEDETLRIAYNGEVYNFHGIKQELISKGHTFYTGTDTETILHLYEEEGPACVKRLNGIFAFAILDMRDNSLFIARDHLGIKPLYYVKTSQRLAFASEIKALLDLPDVHRAVDPAALSLYFRYRFVPDPVTMFEDIYKLPPGHWMLIKGDSVTIERYYNVRSRFHSADSRYHPKSDAEAIELTRTVVTDAVKRQLLSDVPLGAFLSGGVDSSIVVGTMAELMSEPVKTFSIGFAEGEYDEMFYARQISERYKTDHDEIVLSPEHVKQLPDIVWHLDEPLADPAAVPTFFLSQLAQKKVTVVLTGEGGDELYAGYKEDYPYFLGSLLAAVPKQARLAVAQLLAISPLTTGKTRAYRSLLPHAQRAEHVLTDLFRFDDAPILPIRFSPENTPLQSYSFDRFWEQAEGLDWLDKMLYLETSIWLPGDPLMKVDKMSMAHSLEARVPLLDMEVVELALQIPS